VRLSDHIAAWLTWHDAERIEQLLNHGIVEAGVATP
jgi:hypothetical protein